MFYDILYTTQDSPAVKHHRLYADSRAEALSRLDELEPNRHNIVSVERTPDDLL